MKTLTFFKIITILNVLVATGFSVAGILNPLLILPVNIPVTKAIAIFALYAAARTIPIAILTTVSVLWKRCITSGNMAILIGVIQLFDGFIGIYQHDLSKTIGPFIIAIFQFAILFFIAREQREY